MSFKKKKIENCKEKNYNFATMYKIYIIYIYNNAVIYIYYSIMNIYIYIYL